MSDLWYQDYIQLAFRIDKIFRDRIGLPYVDFYYGPLHEFFGIVEPFGKCLIRPWLQGSGRKQTYLRFLAEQWFPSELIKE